MSSQESYLQASGYIFHKDSAIWVRSGYTGISYSDGDDAELRIAGIIGRASDITVFSLELRRHCTDWPSLYHLSGTRANILRPFAAILRGDILEIGAGCGAITRYLGESGANTLALEGSPRRAAIVRSRTRDLENVTVLAEKFDQFRCDHQFDLITLIGVLEYANLFTSGENPALVMLQRVRSLLKPEGKLIIAIENQLGLKYFAGAPEDHLGQPMYGIEGRYRKDQPQTFGRTVLADLLEQAGFATVEFLAPFPDYKLPISILTEEGLSSKKFDGAALAWQSVRRDPQLPRSMSFSLELAWPEIFKNRLALDVANSFLVAVSPSQQKVLKPGILGYHYSTDRIPRYCKETVFEHIDENAIGVNYLILGSRKCEGETNPIINFKCPEKVIYAEGSPLSLEFIKIVTRDGWAIEEVGAFISRYIYLLGLIASQRGRVIDVAQVQEKLPGDFFDMVPQNIIVNLEEKPIPIDTEWSLKGDIELGWLLFRSLLLALGSGIDFGKNSKGQSFSRRAFIKSALSAAGYPLTDEDFSRFIALESVIQEHVSGHAAREFLIIWSEEQLLTYSVAERYGQVNQLNELIDECNRRISRLHELAMERDVLVHTILSSRSWRITRPFRAIARVLRSNQRAK
ncbi:class I SAM-dependent methyltransferase [Nitrosospira multiformis]|uniref:Methyltransferase domain-containing protein n=1 Tax=Nitrosospira multiformis TaxID=1231 RepID=A0A1I7I7Q5_9PROT|nr:class I SAM-dependent methyltransferase [Nitrosospira multiformis]SFU68969.1 Methyltransferase domain-containing protein [Nitrosospira multiformis]